MASMSDAAETDLKEIQYFLEGCEGMRLSLKGIDSTTWGSVDHPHDRAPDLASLRARNHEDIFSRWIRKIVIGPLFRHVGHRFKKPNPVLGLHAYKDSRFLQFTHLLTTLVASSLLITSITILYNIDSMGTRLGVIAAFNVAFSLCLHIFSLGKRIEIFATTSA
jgi:hypothetical protein